MKSAPLLSPALSQEAPALTCRLATLRSVADLPRHLMAACPLYTCPSIQHLHQEFAAAPQFAAIDLHRTLCNRRNGLGVIFLTESDYYARQAAVYMASITAKERQEGESQDYWENIDLESLGLDDEGSDPLENALAVIAPKLLDPSLEEQKTPGLVQKPLELKHLKSPAALIAAPAGRVLTQGILDQLSSLSQRSADEPLDLFIALHPGQVETELLEELRFTYGFQVCRVGRPDAVYLKALLTTLAEELNLTFAPTMDLDKVLGNLRRYRGSDLCDLDLSALLAHTIQNHCELPLQTRDLLFQPYRKGREGMEQLQNMVGLASVKEAVRRMLARSLLDQKRRLAGLSVAPAYRSMAFSGPAGTGKSVTARLVAKILQEEGVGSGRFVEAGREQLIGSYLGQTSPMVAKLFDQARGGVLFIDEAGSLLTRDQQDSYAVEAVNALVRHMELSPETIVIFATYPGEMEQLLASNPGLSSRVAQVLHFEGYDDAALWDILACLAKEEGYTLPQEAREACCSFFAQLRRTKGQDFGNGREARRLFQSALEELALRSMEDEDAQLSPQDFRLAAQRLTAQEPAKQRSIGFC